MLYVFHGTDMQKARAKLRELVAALKGKKPDAAHIKISAENWSESALDEAISSQGLFSDKLIVQIDRVLEHPEAGEALLRRAGEMGSSPNIFVLIEEELEADLLALLEKNAEKVQEYAAPSKFEREVSAFALGDAIGRKDKKMAWVELQKLRLAGLAPEEIHGTVFWQIKSMLVAALSKDEKESGLKPFVYKKSKGFAANFTLEKIQDMSSALVRMFHEAHRGSTTLADALEMFVLGL